MYFDSKFRSTQYRTCIFLFECIILVKLLTQRKLRIIDQLNYDFQEEDRTMDMQTGNQNYLLPRNENANNQQGSPAKRIIYNDNNLVSIYFIFN